MADFKKQGGSLSGREERYDGFEGEPRAVGGALGGGSSTTGTSSYDNTGLDSTRGMTGHHSTGTGLDSSHGTTGHHSTGTGLDSSRGTTGHHGTGVGLDSSRGTTGSSGYGSTGSTGYDNTNTTTGKKPGLM